MAEKKQPWTLLKFAGGTIFWIITTALSAAAVLRQAHIGSSRGWVAQAIDLYVVATHAIFSKAASLIAGHSMDLESTRSAFAGMIFVTLVPLLIAAAPTALRGLRSFLSVEERERARAADWNEQRSYLMRALLGALACVMIVFLVLMSLIILLTYEGPSFLDARDILGMPTAIAMLLALLVSAAIVSAYVGKVGLFLRNVVGAGLILGALIGTGYFSVS
ncbi:MAG: hypothetical protein WAW96_09415 [Alphaproteobacteria bacterium]